MLPRRFLPAMHLLTAFEAVARSGSVTYAARELSLTQSAVSRQIQCLEELVGTELFERRKKRIYLTKNGARYLDEIRNALDTIARSTVSLTENPDGRVLNLSILPTFGTYWLAPKLPEFLAQHPDISIRLVTHLDTFDLHGRNIDAAIFFGESVWSGTQSLRLLNEIVVPACSPSLLSKYRFAHPAELMKAPMLSLSTRPTAWKSWFLSHGVTDDPPQTMIFDQFATLAQAAKHAAGVALLPWFLAEQDFRCGDLVSAYGSAVSVTGSYYLAWPANRASFAPLSSFVTWLKQNAAA